MVFALFHAVRAVPALLLGGSFILLAHCAPRPIAAPVLRTSTTLLLSDTLLSGKASAVKGIKGHLRPESRIKGAIYDDGQQAFTVGLVDVNGDGRFTDPNEDWVLLTVRGNRKVRINGEHGTPHCPVKAHTLLEIDSARYLLSELQDDGSSVKISKLSSLEADSEAGVQRLRLNTRVPRATLKTYPSGDLNLSTLFGQKKLVYIYFWVSQPLEYQVKALDQLAKNQSGRLSIVGVHIKDHDWDLQANESNFFAMLLKPWPQTYCEPDFYFALHQDYSWYRGVLADEQGKVLFPSISPKELQDWFGQ